MTPDRKRQLLLSYVNRIAPAWVESLESVGDAVESYGGSGLESTQTMSSFERLRRGAPLSPADESGLEAVIHKVGRPALTVKDDNYGDLAEPWAHLGSPAARTRLRGAIPNIGRVNLTGHPKPWSGTAFVVGTNLLMTNRHVARDFANGKGQGELSFVDGVGAEVDFVQEKDKRDPVVVRIKKVLMIHPYWDMALLEVDGLPKGRRPLSLATDEPKADSDIVVVGYPAWSSAPSPEVLADIFKGVFDVKRFQPGKITGTHPIPSFGNTVAAVGHDASTLGGNSGSAVLDPVTGQVVALHFAGFYLEMNYAVPAWQLARDPRIVDAGVDFGSGPRTTEDPWQGFWTSLETRGETHVTERQPPRPVSGGEVSVTIPLHITVRLGEPALGSAAVTEAVAPSRTKEEAPEEKLRIDPDPDYGSRRGYDADFLGGGALRVELPRLPADLATDVAFNGWDEDPATRAILPYHHFSVCLRRSRRLAWFVAVNVDGRREQKMERNRFSGDRWVYDPRVPRALQIGDEFYGRPYDRGHLVRRLDPVWGADFAEGKRANDDTFHWTNCSPQHADFNREDTLWAGIEDYILKNTNTRDLRVSVFTGPVCRSSDPMVHGVKVPTEFWKVVVLARPAGGLAATGFLLSQRPLVESPGFVFGDWNGFQVPLALLEEATLLSFGALTRADIGRGREESAGGAGMRRIGTLTDIHLGL